MSQLDINSQNLQLILEALKNLNNVLTEERVIELIKEHTQIQYGTSLPDTSESEEGDVFLLESNEESE